MTYIELLVKMHQQSLIKSPVLVKTGATVSRAVVADFIIARPTVILRSCRESICLANCAEGFSSLVEHTQLVV
jgi:hypothetical protein